MNPSQPRKITSIKHLSADDIAALVARPHRHQFNENAVRMTRSLDALLGLKRIGLHIVRLPPGRESTQFHYHDADEEFIYILSGKGIAEIGESRFDIGPGDFMGFPAPSPGHSIINPHDTDLVYLMGGEKNPADVVHYPRIRRSMIKSHGKRSWVDWQDLHELP